MMAGYSVWMISLFLLVSLSYGRPYYDIIDEGYRSPDTFAQQMIDRHNVLRAKHCAPPLTWSPKAARAAQRWARHLANIGSLQHGDHSGMGQNLAFVSGQPCDGACFTDLWYDEIRDYNFNAPGFSPKTVHFTQVVWKSTTQIGVGHVSLWQKTFVVANYIPPGNVWGGFAANVERPVCGLDEQ
jgi:uncharacterized protein YkwD